MSTARQTERLPDAVYTCIYRWVQTEGELNGDDLAAAMKQTAAETPVGKVIRQLEALRDAGYEDIQGKGYLSAINRPAAREKRAKLVAETIGDDCLQEILTDARIAVLFPPAPVGIQKTRLPLSIGSTGYDARQDYTIKNFLPANSLCSIYGPSGSYKSFLAVSLACHIASGKDWAGKRVEHGAVLYVVGEGGVGVPRRIKAWEMAHNANQPLNSLYLVNRPVFPVRPEEVKEILVATKQIAIECGLPVRFIVIDTLARCFGANDENDARDMGAFIEGCDTIKRETGATLLVVHHSGKDEGKGARGSSAFRAALDAEFNVKREGESKALILTCTKMKDAEEPERRAYDLRVADLFVDDDGETVGSLVVMDSPRVAKEIDPELVGVSNLSENHMAVWQAVRSRTASGEACTRAVIRDDLRAMKMDVKHFSRWVAKLEEEGLLAIDGEILRIQSLREVGKEMGS